VWFDLIVKTEKDIFIIEYLVKQIRVGKVFYMKDIKRWCAFHGIDFKTHFVYRKEFTLKANLWNLYSYWRFCLDEKKIYKKIANVKLIELEDNVGYNILKQW